MVKIITNKTLFLSIVILQILVTNICFAQSRPYEGPDDPAGDIAAERTGWMTGNRVLLFFRNNTELSGCCDLGYDVSKWPNNFEGSKMLDGLATLIGGKVFLENDSIPVENPVEGVDYDTLFFMQSSFRQHLDKDPTGTIEWALAPVFGYFNEKSETPAMSNLPESWPLLGWPAQGDELKWPGEWNGRFGRGVMKADQECYFVVNDAQDQEYLGSEDIVKYYPRPGVYIGDKKIDVTTQSGLPWGGMGIRAEVRAFQWSNPSAQDAIFWEYTVSNISDYTIPEALFGYYVMIGVGGEEYGGKGADDVAYHVKELNMYYAWDVDGIPLGGGFPPGVLGMAYLETPGLPYDGVDNDLDGLLDEKRDNQATVKIGPYEGIDNLQNFLSFYNLNESQLKEHWDADEDQDWLDGVDLNNNGRYDFGEDPGDDLGLDGVGPFDLNYNGPDADGTECNHKPDLAEGIGSEPNFGLTDVNETDMLGLTTFRYHFDWGTGKEVMSQDQLMFEFLSSGILEEAYMIPSNFRQQFASGLFPLYKGTSERISMSELHAYDPLVGLNSDEHKSPALFATKVVVQAIYETDYRFAQPPLTPTLTATASDGKVLLNWDNRSDKLTRDGFVDNKNDFEGYKLYRSTDVYMHDPEIITNGFGSPFLRQPIYQCDLVDTIKGFADFAHINGILVYLGDDSGLSHSFVDNTVQNGRTYYYVLTAYDYGVPDVGDGIPPSENSFVLEVDENENIRRISQNVVIVKPHAPAAGYIDPSITMVESGNVSSGVILPEIFQREAVKGDHTYRVTFETTEVDLLKSKSFHHISDGHYYTSGISVYDVTEGRELVYQESPEYFRLDNLNLYNYDTPSGNLKKWGFSIGKDMYTDVFEGLRLKMNYPRLTAEYDYENSGWIVGSSPIQIKAGATGAKFLPWKYEIIFTEDNSVYTSRVTKKQGIELSSSLTGGLIPIDQILLGESFSFYVLNKDFPDSNGVPYLMDMLVYDKNSNGEFDLYEDEIVVGPTIELGKTVYWGGTAFGIDFSNVGSEEELPKSNDVYRVEFKRPFHTVDSLEFVVNPAVEVSEEKLTEDMDKIKVVPNPYVVTNTMEGAVANWQRNQRRQIMFTHIPAESKISIFTISGILIDEIEVANSVTSRSSAWDLNTSANGTVHWDLRSSEGLEIAAGYYIYHVESKVTGERKIGKFAVIK